MRAGPFNVICTTFGGFTLLDQFIELFEGLKRH
jgi:hypothetical protein